MPTDESFDQFLAALTARLAANRRLPESTYRFQFHAGFTFRDALALVSYLRDLGITDCYSSPFLKARPGSMHGYDIVDHRVLNPQIGSPDDLTALTGALHAAGMGLILDIVPNHMGVTGNENPWWNDVLENGPSSPFAGFFDIEWHPVKPQLDEKVLLPILGEPYGKVLESGQLALAHDQGAFVVRYFDHRFPVAPETFPRVLGLRLGELEAALGAASAEFMEYGSIMTAATHLPARSETDPLKVAERQREKEVIKRRLATLADSSAAVRDHLSANVAVLNGRPGDSHSFDALDELLDAQAYRLAFWRVAADEINYRRFFDVNELAALSMEKPEVFEATHGLVLRLLREGQVNGLRIDHPDGLYDPAQYLRRLQEHYILDQARLLFERDEGRGTRDEKEGVRDDGRGMKDLPSSLTPHPSSLQELEASLRKALAESSDHHHRPLYLIVEKILGRDEPIPEDWPVYGTTGYEFLNRLNGLFVDAAHARAMTRIYQRFAGMDIVFSDLVHQKKFLILQVSLSSELHVLAHQLDRLSEKNRWSRDFTLHSLRHALREIIASFPVYRSYISAAGIHPRDHLYIQTAVVRAQRRNPAISASVFEFVRDMLLLRFHESRGESDRAEILRFVGKFQQVTGPVMAKGLEDTAFYDYNRLVSLNEVGGDPGEFGVSPAQLHRTNLERCRDFPWSLSATSTHDTKRSEDVRARINVLSEIPQPWQKRLARWSRLNRRHRVPLEGLIAPDRNDEYLFYQTLVGTWTPGDRPAGAHAAYLDRIQRYMAKAVHEAKIHTSWINPNPAYDDAVARFVSRVLDPALNARFLDDLDDFEHYVGHFGLLNSLSQTLLKVACPGVPDVYQGTELWDFSLVDPDNRRPVDYGLRRRLLNELNRRTEPGADRLALARELIATKEDGRVKLYVLSQALRCRRDHPGLFTTGEYLPVEVRGTRQESVFAFVRRQGLDFAVAVVPRLMTRLVPGPEALPVGPEIWQDTLLVLPGVSAGQRCRNLFTGEVLTLTEQEGEVTLPVAQVLAHFPAALLAISTRA